MKVEDEKFPVGMRVLVVDDDPTCLKLMEGLLLKCQYHVTTTSQAKEALRMLKKNRNMFDLVISDVHMPDMDGFKLLHILALEMDLPVIMLSAYGESKLVMTGIKYGACDYLLKPVRIQELQNIWQHVVRRNKSTMLRRPTSAPSGGGRALAPTSSNVIQPNETSTEDQEINTAGDYNDHDGQELEVEENEHENEQEEPTTQKKPRLFWSPELHQKFVDAVNQLGLEKAFPKKILDLMNVEGLTREQVASHLQKYRVYLRKMNNAASSQATACRVGSSVGAEDVHIGSLGGGYGVFRSLAGSGSASFLGATCSLSQQQPGGLVVGGLINATSGLSMRGLSSSAMYQRPQHLNPTTLGKVVIEPLQESSRQLNSGLFQAQAQAQAGTGIINPVALPHNRAPLLCQSSNTNAMLNGNTTPQLQITSVSNQCSYNNNVNNSNIIGVVQSSGSASPHNSHKPFPGDHAAAPATETDPLDYFCGISSNLDDSSRGNTERQGGLSGVNSFTNLLGQPHPQSWQHHTPDDYIINSSSLPTPPSNHQTNLSQSSNNKSCSPFSQFGAIPHLTQQNEIQKCNTKYSSPTFDENYLLDDSKLFSSSQNSSEYLEDIVGRFLRQESGGMQPAEEEIGLDQSFADY